MNHTLKVCTVCVSGLLSASSFSLFPFASKEMFWLFCSDRSVGLSLPPLSCKVSLSNLQLFLGYLKLCHISETRLIPERVGGGGRGGRQ